MLCRMDETSVVRQSSCQVVLTQFTSFFLQLPLSLLFSPPFHLPFIFLFLFLFLSSPTCPTWTTSTKLPRHMPISKDLALRPPVLLTKPSLKARAITHPTNLLLSLLAPLFHHTVLTMAFHLAGSKNGTRPIIATSSKYSSSPPSIPNWSLLKHELAVIPLQT